MSSTQVDGGELFISGPGVSFDNQLFANTNGVIRLGAGVELPTNTVVLNGGQIFFTSLSDTPVVIAVDTILNTNALTWNGGLTISNGVTVTNTGISDLLGFTPTNFVSNRVTFKADSKLVVTDGFTIGANKGIVIETNTVTFQVNTNDLLINSPISGGATLRKTGAGHIHLFGSNSYTGGTLIEQGWVGILDDDALGTGKVTLAGGVFEGGFEASPTNVLVAVDSNRVVEMLKGTTNTMVAQHNTTLRYDGNIAEVGTNSGPANLVIGLPTADGTVELGGTNSYTGFTRIQNGATLSVQILADGGTASGIGSSSSAATNLVLNGGTLRYTGGAVSTDRLFSVGNSGGTLDASGTGALDFTNTGAVGFNGQTGARNLTLTGTGEGSLAMVVGDNTGSTALAKTGAGTWTLTATNTYTGNTTIGAGALRIGADANIGTGSLVFSTGSTGKLLVTNSIAMSRDVLLTGNGEIDTATGTTTTLTGGITGAGALAKSGAGTLVVSNSVANTWSGGTAINDGTLKMLTIQGVGTGNITNNGVFEIATTTAAPAGSSSNIFNTISGTGSVVRAGPAGVGISLAGTNDNTYTGLTVVNSGTLRLEKTAGAKAFGGDAEVNGGALIISGNEQTPTNATVTVNAGTFEFSPNIAGGNTVTFGTLDKNGGIIRTYGNTFNIASIDISGGGTNQINRNADESSGTILVRSGGSGLTFSGSSTTTLDIASAASGAANKLVLQNDVAVNMTGGTAQILSTGGGSVVGAIDLDGGSRTFAVGNGSAETDMLVTAAIGNGTLAKTGTGRLALGGNNSYSGGTTLSAGQLRLDTTNAAGTGTLTQTDGSSVLEINAGGTVGNTMSVYNVAFVNGGNTLGGPITLNGATVFTNVESWVQNTITGQLAGTGGITKQGDGALVIAGTASNSFTGATVVGGGSLILNNSAGGAIGGTSIQVDSGATLALATDNQIRSGTALTLAGTGVDGNGALRNISGNNTVAGATTLTANTKIQTDAGELNISGNVTSANFGLTVDGSGNTTLAGTVGLASGALTKSGAGTLTISGSNSSTGILTVNGGKLEVGTGAALGTGAISLDGGTLRTTNTMAITPSTRTMNIGTEGGTIETEAGTTLTYEGIMLGEGKLTKTGTGTFQTGQLANYNVAAAVGGVANAGLGIASYFNFDQLAVGTTNTSVTVTNSFGPSNSMTVTFTGDTGVRQGNSAGLWAAPFLSGGNGAGFGTNGTQQANGADTTPYLATGASTNSTITFILDQHVEYLGILWGSVDAGSNNTLTFRDETNGILFTITGQQVLNSPNGDQGTNGTVYANINSDRPIYSIVATSPQRAFEFDNIALAPQVLRTGPVDILEGTFQIINAGFFNGIGTNDPVFVESGATFSFAGNTNLTQQTIGNLSGGGTVINEGAAAVSFQVNNSSNSTFSGTITDTTNNLNFVKLGAGTLALSGNNTYDGSTVISNGVLQIGDGGTNGTLGGGSVTNLAGLVINRDGTCLVSNNIAGTGGLTNVGPGTVVLTGSNTWTGPTLVSSGTLVLSNTSGGQAAGGTSSIQVDSGATLALGANNQIGNSTSLILNGGTFRVGTDTAGYSETLGTLTLNADSVIDLGAFTGLHTIQFANSSAITWATNATLTISNWQGTAWSPGTAGQLLFGTGGLTSDQLAQIRWDPQGFVGAGLINVNGELTPIPEPRVYAAALALLAAAAWRERKRLRALLRGARSIPEENL